MIRLAGAVLTVVVIGPVAAMAMVLMSLGSIVQSYSNPLNLQPSEYALEDIPPVALDTYRGASRRCEGLPWTVLAGIGKVESNHGRIGGGQIRVDGAVVPPIYGPLLDGSLPGTRVITLGPSASPWHPHPRFDRALGPMQFLTATFAAVGVDGNGDGVATPHNLVDAIHSAAEYLCDADGSLDSASDAIFKYNRSDVYVQSVLDYAQRYGVAAPYVGADPVALVNHPNVSMGPAQTQDLLSGTIDPQLVAILLSLAQDHRFHISSLVTGHSLCVARTGTYPNCTISRHVSGRAADISVFDDLPVADQNLAARQQLTRWLAANRDNHYLRPWAIGHPFDELHRSAPGSFNDQDHEDHFHIAVTGTFGGALPTVPG